jgi:hypothetical protein
MTFHDQASAMPGRPIETLGGLVIETTITVDNTAQRDKKIGQWVWPLSFRRKVTCQSMLAVGRRAKSDNSAFLIFLTIPSPPPPVFDD